MRISRQERTGKTFKGKGKNAGQAGGSGPRGLGSKKVVGDQNRLMRTYSKELGLKFVASGLQLRVFEKGRSYVLGKSLSQHFEHGGGLKRKVIEGNLCPGKLTVTQERDGDARTRTVVVGIELKE